MNWFILIPVILACIALIVFLVRRNYIDEKDFEKRIKEDYHKPEAGYSDIDIDKTTK